MSGRVNALKLTYINKIIEDNKCIASKMYITYLKYYMNCI